MRIRMAVAVMLVAAGLAGCERLPAYSGQCNLARGEAQYVSSAVVAKLDRMTQLLHARGRPDNETLQGLKADAPHVAKVVANNPDCFSAQEKADAKAGQDDAARLLDDAQSASPQASPSSNATAGTRS